jgi:predicted PurR-regulated permease PerM
MNEIKESGSPHWSNSIKLVVSLSLAAILIALIMRFRNLIGPLLLVFILSYLLYPVAVWIRNRTKIPWALVVVLLYLLILLAFGGLITWGGFALFNQIQNFILFLQGAIKTLPDTIAQLSTQTYHIGTFTFDLARFDLGQVASSILGSVEPILKNVGSILTAIAGGAAEFIGWLAFILLVSFFMLLETKGMSGRLFKMEFPGYTEDLQRIGSELGRIWNAFLRGQMIIILITIVVYTILLSILGVKFAFGLAILAGMARFVPYVGPAIAWTTLWLVSFFQTGNYFHLQPVIYAFLNIGCAMLTDTILDNFVATRLLAKTLRIHPAAVMVMAIIGANLIGIIGVVLASPVMASIKLFWRYVVRKMFDMDPWEGIEIEKEPPATPVWITRLESIFNKVKDWVLARVKPTGKKVPDHHEG